MKRIFVICLAICLLDSAPSWATPDTNIPLPGGFLNVEYSTGTGDNTAYFIVDFGGNPSNPGPTYAFSYHWDGTQAADTALLAISAVPGGLGMLTENFGSDEQPNLSIDTFSYLSNTDTPDFDTDGRFWNYYLGTYTGSGVDWAASDFGISGREFGDQNGNDIPNEVLQDMTNGGFYGFYASADTTVPRLPVAVPEPATLVLIVSGGLLAIGGSAGRRRLLLCDAVESAQAPHEIARR